ncbi:hypothetical protein [Orbus mooreae]|uniref:hypothetical protein n=1 Tax=Orbus mooreae TaxID=3074107 RepID=UPI00370D386E
MSFQIASIGVLTMLTLLLVGCGNEEERKAWQVNIQESLDIMNPEGDRGFCFAIENVNFPYINQYYLDNGQETEWDKYQKLITKNIILVKSLNRFADLGLLNKKAIENNSYQFEYDLSNEGKHYFVPEVGFCFGRQVLNEVNLLESISKNQMKIRFTYTIENLPDWASDSILNNQIYHIKMRFLTDRLYEKTIYPTKKLDVKPEIHSQ